MKPKISSADIETCFFIQNTCLPDGFKFPLPHFKSMLLDPDMILTTHHGKGYALTLSLPFNRKSAEIMQLCVLPEYRRSGIGLSLVISLIDYLKSENYQILFTTAINPLIENLVKSHFPSAKKSMLRLRHTGDVFALEL